MYEFQTGKDTRAPPHTHLANGVKRRHHKTPKNWTSLCLTWSRGGSVSIVSGYGLDGQAIEVRSPVGAKDSSSSICVQTGSEAHPGSCPMGTGGSFPGGKARPGREADHLPPSSAEIVNEQQLYFLSPKSLHGV
jgi:hypothetical protein